MAWTDAIGDIFNRYSGAAGGAASAPADPHQDYCNIAEAAAAGDGRCIGAHVPVRSDTQLSRDGIQSVSTVESGPASRAAEPPRWSDQPCYTVKCSRAE
jgi:hypothetical protein